jgi:DNA-binding NarL/FixJ family response regulator
MQTDLANSPFHRWRFPLVYSPDESSPAIEADAPARILVVEDEFIAAIALQDGLIEAGYEVVGLARTADQAVTLARMERPLLVIMDIRLIGSRDGVDAALEIYRDTGLRCIFATALHDLEIRRRAEAALPLGWLPKPYTVNAVVTMIEAAKAELRAGKH